MSTISTGGGFDDHRRRPAPAPEIPITPEKFGGGELGTILALLIQRGSVDESVLFPAAATLKRLPSELLAEFRSYGEQLVGILTRPNDAPLPKLPPFPASSQASAAVRVLNENCSQKLSNEVGALITRFVRRARDQARGILLTTVPESVRSEAQSTIDAAIRDPVKLLGDYGGFRRAVVAAEGALLVEREFGTYGDILENMKRPLVNTDGGALRPPNFDPEGKFAALRYVEVILDGFLRDTNRRVLREYEHLGGVRSALSARVERPEVIDLNTTMFGSESVDERSNKANTLAAADAEYLRRQEVLEKTLPAAWNTLAAYVSAFNQERGLIFR